MTIDGDGFSEDAGRLGSPFAVLERTYGVVLADEITGDRGGPEIVLVFGERDGLEVLCVRCSIETQLHLLGDIGPESEIGLLGTIEALVLQFGLVTLLFATANG